MAYDDFIAAPPDPAAHPLAKPGYGKRSAPDQSPPRNGDFEHLPARAAYLAGLLDRLSENAAMDAKTIAKAQPLYGQAAVRTTLNELGVAGHLRRVRRQVPSGESVSGTRWVFHTYWSRTARDNEWWAVFLRGDVVPGAAAAASEETDVQEPPAADEDPEASGAVPPPEANSPRPERSSAPSAAYDTLARLGLQEPRLALSAADCAALEQLAAEWVARGASPEHLTHALLAGLPNPVHSPRAFVKRRLIDKMPPERTVVPATPTPGPRRRLMLECTNCRVPGRPEALPGGLCRGCRSLDGSGPGVPERSARQPDPGVRALVAQVRAGLRVPQRV
ncbi:hypothetical protein [Streptomyces geranii]|uniref:hypothetical protein n=1 Tax=Streptomyces geranii TaxID=2058923 RepID=UPI000D027D5D|nr:hypothetical protein [Streptomyces geranii]